MIGSNGNLPGLTEKQLQKLRDIANGNNSMVGHTGYAMLNVDRLIRKGYIIVDTVHIDTHPYTGYFLTEKGAQELDDQE